MIITWLLSYWELDTGAFSVRTGFQALVIGLATSIGMLLGWWGTLRVIQKIETRKNIAWREECLDRQQFISRLDHEMRNPLTALRMELAYLVSESDGDDTSRVLSDMAVQLERLSRTVTDLRKITLLEEGGIQPSEVDLLDVLREVLDAAQDHPNYDQHIIKLELTEDDFPEVCGDRGLLWIALFNLLDNALKFTPTGSMIQLRAFERDPWVIIEVIDNGPGIPSADLPHIFDELYRGKNALGIPGSGLGLALVRTVVNLHEGSITVDSQKDQGSRITLKLPMAS